MFVSDVAKLGRIFHNAAAVGGSARREGRSTTNVIPAQAGIQTYQMATKALVPGFRRGDDFLRIHLS